MRAGSLWMSLRASMNRSSLIQNISLIQKRAISSLEKVDDEALWPVMMRFYNSPQHIIFYQSIHMYLRKSFPIAYPSFHSAKVDGTTYWFMHLNNKFTANLISATCEGSFNVKHFNTLYTQFRDMHKLYEHIPLVWYGHERFANEIKKDAENNQNHKLEAKQHKVRTFYMTSEARESLRNMNLPDVPKGKGYELGTPDPDKDAELMNEKWPNRSKGDLETTREKIRRLPCVCVRQNGIPVCFGMLTNIGSGNNMYCDEEHRKAGLGMLVLMHGNQRVIRAGYHVYHNVYLKNKVMLGMSRKSWMYTELKEDDGHPSTFVIMPITYPNSPFYLDPNHDEKTKHS